MKNILVGLIGIIFIGFIFYLSSLKMEVKENEDLIELEKEQEMLENNYEPNYENYKFNENEK